MIVTSRPPIRRISQPASERTAAPRTHGHPSDRVGPPRRGNAPRAHAVTLAGRRPANQSASSGQVEMTLSRRATQSRYRIALRLDVIVPLLLFIFALTQNLHDIGTTPYHPDESRWLNRGHYVADFLDPFGPTWDDQYLTRGQPPLGSYVMGIGLILQGKTTHPNRIWDFSYGADWNTLVGASPSNAILRAGRRTNTVIGALVVVCVYFIGKGLSNRVGGVVGALFLAVHPLQIWIASQALSDQTLILLLALAMLAAMWLGRGPTRWRALLLGAILGLGGAAKLTPLLLSLPLAVMGAFFLIRARTRFAGDEATKDRRLGWSLFWQPVIAYAVFIAVYPYLWPEPIRRTIELFRWRKEEMDRQVANWPNIAVSGPLAALDRIGHRLTDVYSSTGRVGNFLASMIGINWHPHGIDLLPVLIGALIMIVLVFQHGLRSPQTLAIVILVCETGAIVVGMRVDFYRYHLPIVFAMAVSVALCFGALWTRARSVAWWRVFNAIPGLAVSMPGSRAQRPRWPRIAPGWNRLTMKLTWSWSRRASRRGED